MDILCSAIGLLLLSPIFLIIAVVIKLDSPGPVFYHGRRIGRGGKPFRIHKFRTMVKDADTIGPGLTAGGDRRVTKVGRFLRKTKLDELPQLINVLGGSMSLVGPRPEDPRYVALYTPEHRRVLEVRPGITSLASVTYRDEEQQLVGDDWERHYVEVIMPQKLTADLYYVDHASVWGDFKIILQTIAALIR